jgi:hypothetical protein
MRAEGGNEPPRKFKLASYLSSGAIAIVEPVVRKEVLCVVLKDVKSTSVRDTLEDAISVRERASE